MGQATRRKRQRLASAVSVLQRLGVDIATQDNAATSHPVFVVEQRRRIYGLDPDYCDAPIWLHQDGFEADAEEKARLDAEDENGAEDECWRKTGYVDIWEFVTACFTRKGAERFLERQRHNLKHPRIYIHSAHRNDEWIELRKVMVELGASEVGR